jgi:hypothetical protein
MNPDISNMDEVCCPDCGKPLVVTVLENGQSKFDGCGRGCRLLCDIPQGSIMFGAKGAPMFIYKPRAA